MPTPATVTLVTRAGCHLCDDARAIVAIVVAENENVRMTEVSLDDDAALAERFAEEIPVVLINGRIHNIWRVDADRLRVALGEATQ